MNKTRRPTIIAALCPKFEKLNTDDPDKAIDETLQLLRERDYRLFFWVIAYRWGTPEKIAPREIAEMRRYGTVRLFEGRRVESKARARLFRTFVADEVLA
jgi:hypothetical protein